MTRRTLLLTATTVGAAVLALTGCGSGAEGPQRATSTTSVLAAEPHRLVGPDEFAAVIAEPDRVTINVHVPFEGDIAGTDLAIPFDHINEQAEKLPASRDTPLAIYCRTGPMSAEAAVALTALGYTDVVELRGGMIAWQDSGRALVGV